MRAARGFTLIELVVVMVLVSALAVFALPRLVDTQLWQLRAFGDDLMAQLQFHQRLALQQRRSIVATITGSAVSFAYAGGASLGQISCPGAVPNCIAEGGSRTVTFNQGNTGQTFTTGGAALTVTISGSSYSQAYRVENDTGLVYPLP